MGDATTIGRPITWSIPSGLRDAILADIGGGTITGFSKSLKGEKKVRTQDGKKISVTYYGDESEVKLTVLCEANTVEPERGQLLSNLLGNESGLVGGKIVVDGCEVMWKESDDKELSISATHYPDAED